MKLRQLECFLEVVRSDFSMSRAAAALGMTQPAVSKQIRLLESELGISLFAQRGNRLLHLSEAGTEILRSADALWQQVGNMQRIAQDYSGRSGRTFSVATTFTHARYVLVHHVKAFISAHPHIDVRLQHSAPERILRLVIQDKADIGILTQPAQFPPELVSVPCYEMRHSVVAPHGHPLLSKKLLTLEMLAQYPIVSHDLSRQIGREIDRRFREAGLRPKFVLQAQDSDVIKAYVEAGLGIAIVPKIAFSPLRDRNLRSKDVSHLFAPTTTHVVLKRGAYPAAHVIDFIQAVAPQYSRKQLDSMIRSP